MWCGARRKVTLCQVLNAKDADLTQIQVFANDLCHCFRPAKTRSLRCKTADSRLIVIAAIRVVAERSAY